MTSYQRLPDWEKRTCLAFTPKSFPVETDEHYYQMLRYVERNVLRAKVVDKDGLVVGARVPYH